MDLTELAEHGNKLWRDAAENPESYDKSRDFAQFCIDHHLGSPHLLELAEKFILQALSLRQGGQEKEDFLFFLSEIYLIKGQHDLERDVLGILLSINGTNLDYLRRYANACSHLGLGQEASVNYRKALDLEENQAASICRHHDIPPTRVLYQTADPVQHVGEICLCFGLLEIGRTFGFIDRFRAVALAPLERVCNEPLLDLWRDRISIVSRDEDIEDFESRLDGIGFNTDFMPVSTGDIMHREFAARALRRRWLEEDRPPLLQLPDTMLEKGRTLLRDLGMPDGAWFACLHVRESGFHKYSANSPADKNRNGNIEDYIQAIESVTKRGGWVVRIGDASMQPLPEMTHVIDGAHRVDREPWNDIFLMGACRFFIATTSGPFDVASTFDVPVVGTNWVPLVTCPTGKRDIFVPRLLRAKDTGRKFTIKEYMTSPFFWSFNLLSYDLHNGYAEANTSEEIDAAVVEMMDNLDGTVRYDEEDERRQELFKVSYERAQPEIVSMIGGAPLSRISRHFLQCHPEILE